MGDPVFYGLPLYPYFLALGYKLFHGSILAIKTVQVFLGVSTLFFVYKIGEKTAGSAVGLLAAGIGAFYGPLFFHETIFIPESLGVPLYAVGFYLFLVFLEKRSFLRGLVLGVVFGLAALTKAGIILFIFSFCVIFFLRLLRKRESLWPVLACLLGFLLTLLPVTAHNYLYGKDRVFLTYHAGLNLYIGNHPGAEGVFAAPEGMGSNVDAQLEDSRKLAERALGRSLKPSEISKYWRDKALRFVVQNPRQFLKLCARKLLLFFDAREISDVEDYEFSKNFVPFLKWPWVTFGALGPFVLLGFLACWKCRHRFWIYLWTASYLLGVMLYFVNARYRLPLLSVFFVMAAVGLFRVYESWKARAWPRVFLYAFILLAGVWVTQLRLVGTSWARDYVNAGDVYLEKEEPGEAMRFYEKALSIDPGSAKAHLAMGLALSKSGRADEAKERYLKVIEIDPSNSQAYNNLGMWYDRKGDGEEAERLFLKAVELKPHSFQAHNNLGMVYGKRGQYEKAIHEFGIALELNPKSYRAHTNLGLVFYRLGEKGEALRHWEKALEINPEFQDAKLALKLFAGRES